MIEARWLFGVEPSQIEVVVHPQSIIHSMVQFEDSSVMAQLGQPDMRMPIQYAFSYPVRLKSDIKPLNFFEVQDLTFEKPDIEKFPNLTFAYEAIKTGGNMPCILNAANEVAVALFFEGTDWVFANEQSYRENAAESNVCAITVPERLSAYRCGNKSDSFGVLRVS